MNKKEKAKAYITRSLLAILGIGIGILIVAQVRSLPAKSVANPVQPYLSLKETRDLLYSEQGELKNEVASLQNQVEDLKNQLKNKTMSPSEIQALDLKRAQAGLTKVSGPGVKITLNDSTSSPVSDESIIHAADLRDITNLLWGSSAEAISINSERVVASTSIDCIVNTILVNSSRLSTPFTIEVIGDQNLMYDRLVNQNILTDLHNREKVYHITFDIEKNSNLTLPKFSGVLNSELTSKE